MGVGHGGELLSQYDLMSDARAARQSIETRSCCSSTVDLTGCRLMAWTIGLNAVFAPGRHEAVEGKPFAGD
jgi:hypothetical protein